MAKKYLDLEEAAQQLGISVDEMKRLRESGELRGFADRGTWKFKADDVAELARIREADSNPEVPLLDEQPESGSSVVLGAEEGSSLMLPGDGDLVGEQPTVIQQSALEDESGILDGTSDSDVRLILDDSLVGGADDSDAEVEIPSDSDSDVRLVDEAGPAADTGSDSDVKLVGADSDDSDDDVQIIPDESSVIAGSSVIVDDRSDSDVRLIPDKNVEAASDSDVQLIGDAPQSTPDSDSDVQLVSPDDGSSVLAGGGGTDVDSSLVSLDDDSSTVSLDDDSGISLQSDANSGISLEQSADSGISLEPDVDSGISLADDDSGIALEPDVDSGISLARPQDSGIALEGDSGIRLADAADSGISLDFGDAADDGGVTETIPVMETPVVDDGGKTELEVPTLDDDGSEFDLAVEADETGDGADTSVILFDDDEDVDEYSATAVGGGTPQERDVFDMEEDFDDDDLEVAADVVGEDDELDVFDAVDEDFEDTFDTGESHAEFVAPAAGAGQVAAAVEADWGVGTFLGLLFSTALMLLLGVLVFDLVRSMWTWNEPTGISTTLIGTFRDLF